MEETSENSIPYLIKKYEELMEIHEEQWMNTYKPFGWEELEIRYAGVISRLKYAKKTIEKYLSKKILSIPELEFEFLDDNNKEIMFGCAEYKKLATTGL